MTIKDIGFLTAFWGGFSSFFSIWQLCLMQITPFFLAFAAGFYLLQSDNTFKKPLINLFWACIGYMFGFSIIFALMGTSGYPASGYIIYNIDDFRTAAATSIGLIALLFFLSGVFNKGKSIGFLCLPIGFILGASFAVVYSPCIPPVMSDIMNFAGKPANALKGFILLTIYGFGVTSAFVITGMAISAIAGRFVRKRSTKLIVIIVSSTILLVMSFLIVTNLMVRYKSLLVGSVLD